MLKISRCPSCESPKIQLIRQDWIGKYKGQTYVVPDLEYDECPVCGEMLYDRLAMRSIEAYSPALQARKRLDASPRRATREPNVLPYSAANGVGSTHAHRLIPSPTG